MRFFTILTLIFSFSLAHADSSEVSSQFFSQEEIQNESFVDIKLKAREELCKGRCLKISNKTARGYEDMLLKFFSVDKMPMQNIYEIDQLNIKNVELESDIWSGSYWPIYRGGLSYRYAGGGPAKKSWKSNYRRRVWPPHPGSSSTIDRFSPAEKYDLLIGDRSYSLAHHMWQKGAGYRGSVPTWAGLCHGWAPAAIYEDRPMNAVTVKGANGESITFRPSDLKGLASTLWANGSFKMLYTGSRCNERRPRTDGRIERIRSQRCFDINPGLWHTILTNVVGKNKESFVFDASYDAEVWNHPIVGYKIQYFNMKDRKVRETLEEAIAPVGSFGDAWGGYRSDKTRYIVGIRLSLNYKNVNAPSRGMSEDTTRDRVRTRTYRYDLELDENGKIIGGEWHQKSHPDMVWKAAGDSMALSPADMKKAGAKIDLTNGSFAADWLEQARADSRKGIPSAKIIRRLIEMSRQ